jgi:hypothetical protein
MEATPFVRVPNETKFARLIRQANDDLMDSLVGVSEQRETLQQVAFTTALEAIDDAENPKEEIIAQALVKTMRELKKEV